MINMTLIKGFRGRKTVVLALLLLNGCTTFKPEALSYHQLRLSNKETPLNYAVYTPPNWQPGERLPIVLFLHGGGGSYESFERYQADEYLNIEINAGRLPRFILMTPNGNNGFWMTGLMAPIIIKIGSLMRFFPEYRRITKH